MMMNIVFQVLGSWFMACSDNTVITYQFIHVLVRSLRFSQGLRTVSPYFETGPDMLYMVGKICWKTHLSV